MMERYKPRKIEFNETIKVDDWSVKIYTIAKHDQFDHPVFYQEAKKQLPKWLCMENSFDSSHDKIGFLILHSGTEGIFSVINWWVGKNMLNTHIFLTDPKDVHHFVKISGDGLAPCIWELDVINHERLSWRKNILHHPSQPNYQAYLDDVYDDVVPH